MENNPSLPYSDNNPGEPIPSPSIETVAIPPRPELEEKKGNIWVRSLTSLVLYLGFGYFFFGSWSFLLIITGIVVFHELGHFFAMKFYDYKELGIFFIPLLGAYASGSKHETSQKQSAVILLAGPLPGIIVGIGLYLLNDNYYHNNLLDFSARILIFLNLLNLFPVYPLDGGQLLNRLFLDEYHIISRVFVVLSAAAIVYIGLEFIYPRSYIVFFILLYFPLMMLIRMVSEIRNDMVVKKIESEGVDLNVAYEDISDEDYWKIRNAVIKHHPELKNIPAAPPYEYADREDKVILAMKSLLQRNIIMDLSLFGKIFIILIWAACFFAPFLLDLQLRFF